MSAFADKYAEYARTLDCVHCGLCLPHCPTHGVTGREADSPRGRIHLMRGWAEGRIELTDEAHRHLDLCIVCRACESVCPSGIRMGDMMESFRAERPRATAPPLSRFLMRTILPYRNRIAALTRGLALYERTPLPRFVDSALQRVAPALARAHAMRPDVRSTGERPVPAGSEWPARADRRARVGLFLGCVAPEWLAPVHHATIRVLTQNGCDVVVPPEQTCCGALHRHAGLLDDARRLLAENASAFPADLDAVIVNAAGCGASLKEPLEKPPGSSAHDALSSPDHAPSGQPAYRDVCEFLHDLGLAEPTRPVRRRVAYDQPCHLVHGQRIGADTVSDLLARIPELEQVALAGSERCCGAGGVYNLVHAEMADAVLHEKVEAILASGADTVVTGNPGCLLQLRGALREHPIEVLHPIQVLDEAYA